MLRISSEKLFWSFSSRFIYSYSQNIKVSHLLLFFWLLLLSAVLRSLKCTRTRCWSRGMEEKYEYSLHDIAESGKRTAKNMIAIFKVFLVGSETIRKFLMAFFANDAAGADSKLEWHKQSISFHGAACKRSVVILHSYLSSIYVIRAH